MASPEPLHCTITFIWSSDSDYEFINAQRTEHYPPTLLFNPAHVGLLTRVTVPPTLLDRVKSDIRDVTATQHTFYFKFRPNVALFRKCVVLRVKQSGKAEGIRAQLNFKWASEGIVDPQERKASSYQPHVTIHGRISKEEASRVFPIIEKSFKARSPLQGQAVGINLWEYNEGQPWRLIESFPFGG